jgi:hypothetical protein
MTALVKLYERLNFFSYYGWNFGALQQPEFGTKSNEIWSVSFILNIDSEKCYFCSLLKRPNAPGFDGPFLLTTDITGKIPETIFLSMICHV